MNQVGSQRRIGLVGNLNIIRFENALKHFVEVGFFILLCLGGAYSGHVTEEKGFNATSFMGYRAITLGMKYHIRMCGCPTKRGFQCTCR